MIPLRIFLFYFLANCLTLTADAQETISVDMNADWIRRDWKLCREAVQTSQKNGTFAIHSNHAAALFWQVPTRAGSPLPIDRNQDWIQRCERPPRDFETTVKKMPGATDQLISIADYPYISWHWRVNATIDDRGLANRYGEINKNSDDFAAKIGITFFNDKEELRELAYVWTHSIPEETALSQVTTVIPWVLKFKWYRIVAETGDQKRNTWVFETRNLYQDFKRFYPDEEPREIVRIYLMSDSDNTGTEVQSAFSNVNFYKTMPQGYVKTDTHSN